MSGTRNGAIAVAAIRIGITVSEYRQHMNNDEKYCWRCKTWYPKANFCIDRSRGDGLSSTCAVCRNIRKRRVNSPSSSHVQSQASSAVSYAIKKGELPHISSMLCVKCGKRAEHYHHHLGYAPENWLSVIPLCRSCHRKSHYE